MTALTRQNTLFVAEDWVRIYEALENVDFRAYDFDNLVRALMQYLRSNYPEEFNDWIASSEFVTKVEILAWLSQNIAFRVDLNTRENFISTAERRDSLIRLAQNIGYKVNRVRSANGLLKIKSVRTTQQIVDSNGVNLQNRNITWNDPRDEDWFERFILIFNQAFVTRTQFGFPLSTFSSGGVRTDQYVFNSAAPTGGTYRFGANVNGINIPFDIYNGELNSENGLIEEIPPNPENAFNLIYRIDGKGFGSENTGFFFPFKQGNLSFQDEFFSNPEILRVINLPATNVNNDDFFVQEIDADGNIISDWTQVDTTFGEGVSFNTLSGTIEDIYEVDTLTNDKVRVRFGDGTFGRIPVGRFRFWYRTANPTPTQIRPSAIQNQSISIPYTKDGALYTLTMTYSLEAPVNNGAPTESNFDIRTRAGKAFYTQNRMVNAQDYNNFFLKDSSIQKIKTVNRTFAGQSRYARLNDPTSLYQNVKHVAEDGRLFQDETVTVDQYSADTNVLPVEAFINQFIKPLIRKADKKSIYFNRYTEIIFSNNYRWKETSQIGNQSRGNVTFSGTVQVVGDAAGGGNLVHIGADAVIRFNGPKGPAVTVDRVIEDGDAADGIILRDVVEDDSTLFSIFPAIRNNFTQIEENELKTRIEQRLDFALSWNQATETWQFINSENINKTAPFSLDNQGDTSGTAQDASWLILLEYLPSTPTDIWRVTDRGESLFFESAREVDFIFSNTSPSVDPETGRSVRDSVVLLESNEARDSLRRRGLEDLGDGSCDLNAYTFMGDGTTKCFKTQEVPLLEHTTVVRVNGEFKVFGIDFTIEPSITGYSVCFTVAPPDGAVIEIRTASEFRNASLSVIDFVADGVSDEYNLFVSRVNASNIIAFLDGVIQNSSLDFGIGDLGADKSIVFNEIIGSDVKATIFIVSGIDNQVFAKHNFKGDGTTTDFNITAENQSEDTVLVSIDGIIQAPSSYTITAGSPSSTISFNTPPGNETKIRVIGITNPGITQSFQYEFAANGSQNSFTLSNNTKIPSSGAGVIVTVDGIMQDGPWATTPVWTVTGSNVVLFSSPPPADTTVQVFVVSGTVGIVCDLDPSDEEMKDNNQGDLSVESCLVNYIGQDIEFTPSGVIRHPDGYVNKNGLAIVPVDADFDGVFDLPFIFKDLVIQDGFTDLVLWRRIQEFGFDVFDPINDFTSPKGTYGNSQNGYPAKGDTYDPELVGETNDHYEPETVQDGDIHYDVFTGEWLVADGVTRTWQLAEDQAAFKARIGRDHLKFIWTHYAPEANRIDPSKSNVMNVYMLTSGFDEAFRTWLEQNGQPDDEPIPETSEQLRIQYQDFEDFKPLSDAIIYYPARYKPLFGDQAVPELQAIFKIIQTQGSRLSESDLKLRVLNAVREYFDVDRWDFGERFYFTELVAFVHAALAPDLQSMVIVPRGNDQAFGRLFQVRAEPDELFVSAASPDDIEVVRFFTDEELRIGTLI